MLLTKLPTSFPGTFGERKKGPSIVSLVHSDTKCSLYHSVALVLSTFGYVVERIPHAQT